MFKCEFNGGHQSENGDAMTVVVVEWRKMEYPSVELPKLFGDPHRRFSRGGKGYEAAQTKNACSACAPEALKNAPAKPIIGDTVSIRDIIDKPLLYAQDIPPGLAFGKMGARFTLRLAATCYYPKGKVIPVTDITGVRGNKKSYLLIENVSKKAEDPKFVSVSFKIVLEPIPEALVS